MSLLKKSYGRLGKLTRTEWKRFLASGTGVFQKTRTPPPPSIVGPTLTKSPYPIQGDSLFRETVFFQDVATKEQKALYDELTRSYPSAAGEYLLTITGMLSRWKEDIRWLRVILNYLQRRESVLQLEEKVLKDAGKQISEIGFPEILKRHFPDLFKDLELEDTNFEQLLARLRQTEEKMKLLEHTIREYLLRKEANMPFLFE